VPACQPFLNGPFDLDFVLVPPGSFWMGAQPGECWMGEEERPRHRVTLSRGFYLSTSPVTRGQWRAVMDDLRGPRGRDLPVECVSLSDCLGFCLQLGHLLRRRCRLPTEAEWEYACRACTQTMYCSGDGVDALRQVGWCSYSGNWDEARGPRPVRQMRPNSWGLYDMHGNVWEWCADWFSPDYYDVAPEVDPTGPDAGSTRVVRGGSWRGGPWFCRSAQRRDRPPTMQELNLGFRVVAGLEEKAGGRP
jgi:formylglycine-generating enzyme required for sulfatase activity